MDPTMRRFYTRNALIYAMALGFAASFLRQPLLSLLPAVIASATCITVPALGFKFLKEDDRSVFVYTWFVDVHLPQPSFSSNIFDHLLSFRAFALFVIALIISDHTYLFLINNPKAELGNFAHFHFAVRDGLLGVVALLRYFVNGFSQVVDGLRYVVNGFQYGGSLTLGSLAVVEKWIKASGEVLTKRPLEEIQASDTPPLYSGSNLNSGTAHSPNVDRAERTART